VGLPDEKWGDRVHAVIAGRAGIDVAQVLAFAAGKLANYKMPKSIEVWQDCRKASQQNPPPTHPRPGYRARGAWTAPPRGVRESAPGSARARVKNTPTRQCWPNSQACRRPTWPAYSARRPVAAPRRSGARQVRTAHRWRDSHSTVIMLGSTRIVRANATFLQAYENFERINVQLKTLITDGKRSRSAERGWPTTHSDASYDIRIVDRLGKPA